MLWATGLALIAVAARRMAYLLWAGPCSVSSLFLLDQKKGTCAAVAPCFATAAVTAARMRRRGVLGQERVCDGGGGVGGRETMHAYGERGTEGGQGMACIVEGLGMREEQQR